MPQTFTDEARKAIGRLLDSILSHPFLRELSDGSLSVERFARYLIQDSYYLVGFSQALSLASVRAEDPAEVALHRMASADAMEVERALHLQFFRRFGVADDAVRRAFPNPVCSAYVDFLLALAYHHPYPLLIAGVLPCNWIYLEVGKVLNRDAGPQNPFLAWIEAYSAKPFADLVSSYVNLADRIAEGQTEAMRGRMLDNFVKGARLEYLFWDAAYRGAEWPPL